MKLKEWFKSTKEKAETALDNVTKDTTTVLKNANELIDQSQDTIKTIVGVLILGFGLSVVSNVMTMYTCSRVMRTVNRNDLLADVVDILKKKK